MNVLIATDSLELGKRALADTIKDGVKDRVIVAYMLFPAAGDRTGAVINIASVEGADEAISEQLFAEARRLGERHGATIQTALIPGDSPSEVAKAVIDQDAGRVVIASHADPAALAEHLRATTKAEVSVVKPAT